MFGRSKSPKPNAAFDDDAALEALGYKPSFKREVKSLECHPLNSVCRPPPFDFA
ncbi:hypothetical protein FRC00_011144 [Tulasnella sp. 408]|nr:hypothetical protein FRC00_011144 [Tulasnella sp. 408]